MRTKFVNPIPFTSVDEAIERITGTWPDKPQARLLAPIVVRMKPLPKETSDTLGSEERAARGLLRQLDKENDAGLALVRFLATSFRDHEVDPVRDEFADALRQSGFDYETAFARYAPRHGFNPTREEAARLYLHASLIDPARLIDWARQVAFGSGRLLHPEAGRGTASDGWKESDDPRSLSFWLRVDFDRTVKIFEAQLEITSDDEELICLEKALHRAIFWRNTRESTHHHENYRLVLGDHSNALRLHQTFFRNLVRGRGLENHPRLPELLLRLRFMAWEGEEASIGEDLQKQDVATAMRELGMLRATLTELGADDQHQLLWAEREHMRACTRTLFTGSGIWAGMKSLLLMIRTLKGPVFEPDLSWWLAHKNSKRAPGVVSLANDLMFGFQAFARTEQEDDPKLVDLRTELARFCVERLSTRKDKSGPTEPDPTWRYGYVRALGELGVNPDGKGHRTLHHVMNDDDDRDVREAARKIYPRLREQRAAPEGNPRRAVLAALWWIRQAQMIAVGAEVDSDGANRTRAEEVRYTARGHRNE